VRSAALNVRGAAFLLRWSPKSERRAPDMAQGTVKDNARDELDEAAGRGRRDREDRKEATPEEVKQPGSGGVKDNVQDEWAESQERR
jgi:hypothetical protein